MSNEGKAAFLNNNDSQTEIHSRKPSFLGPNAAEFTSLMNDSDRNNDNDNSIENNDEMEHKNNGNDATNSNDDDELYLHIKKPFLTESSLHLCGFILGWYIFSVTISLYNKWMFDKSTLNLPFPVLITSFHQLLLSIMSYITINYIPSFKQDYESSNNSGSKESFNKLYFLKILPCAAASAGDIGCGNMSFRFITLTTYTMVKSSSIAFVLLFGVLFKLEKLTLNLFGIVMLMVFGIMLMVDHPSSSENSGNDHFFLGFFLVLTSSMMSGLRWVFTQLILHLNNDTKKNKKKKNPIFTIYQLSPTMFVCLFLFGSVFEGLGNFIKADIWETKGILNSILLLLFPGFLVFFMTIFEFGILQRSQVITLSIAGIFKELITILISTFIFDDRLTFMNLVGLLITLVDIVWYNYYRYKERVVEEYKTKRSIELDII